MIVASVRRRVRPRPRAGAVERHSSTVTANSWLGLRQGLNTSTVVIRAGLGP
jgi:hypothetical protein